MADDLPDALDVLDDRRSTDLNRREFLTYVSASLAATACSAAPGTSDSVDGSETSGPDTAPRDTGRRDVAGPDAGRGDTAADAAGDTSYFGEIPADPFQLGVASGDPTPERVMIWTRLIPEPPAAGRMPSRQIPVVWEVAGTDQPIRGVVSNQFDENAIVRSGTAMAKPEWAHSVHVDVSGLDPDSWYNYRFRIGDRWTSRVGQTRTLPGPDAEPDRFRVATACCQAYPEGFFRAHHHLAREDRLDLVFFLGDYVYEKTAGTVMRSHPQDSIPSTLEEFRHRYAAYKSEPELVEAHAHCPWVITWDDHEVRNNYAGDETVQSGLSMSEFKQIRAAAYQAYYEHLPIRVPERPDDSHMKIYQRLQVGDLVEFDVLDGRQYRNGISCSGDVGGPCDEATSPRQTMLGDEQFEWLDGALEASSTIWHAIVQQTVFTPINFGNNVINADMWDGYQHERQQIIDLLVEHRIRNPLILTGDIHMGMFLDVPRDDDDPGENGVAYEIVATSVTSENTTQGWGGRLESLATALGQVRYFNPDERGYTVIDYHRDEVRVRYRTVSDVHKKESSVETDTSFRIEEGTFDVTKS
jgi:alkaline phosphatase D